MKIFKLLAYTLAALIIAVALTSCTLNSMDKITPQEPTETTAHFRQTTWGMSIEEVNKVETAKLVGNDKEMAIYSDSVANLEAYVIYAFENGELFMGFYNFQNPHTQGTAYIADFDGIKEKVASIYGTPTTDTIELLNDLWGNNAKALMMDSAIYTTTWVLEESVVLLTMSSDNYVVTTSLAYRDITYWGAGNTDGL